jgi:hypothetical protein
VHAAQELVIGGFTAPRGSRTDLGALLVGHFDDGALPLRRARWGTGFTAATLRELAERLAPLVRETPPFEPEKGHPARARPGSSPSSSRRSRSWSGRRRPAAPPVVPRRCARQGRRRGRARGAPDAERANSR